MSSRHRGGRSTVHAVERQALSRALEFFAPHFVGPFVLGFGLLCHVMWGDHNSPFWAKAYIPLVMLLVFGGLSFLAWRYSAARPMVQRAHVVGSILWTGLLILLLDVLGWKLPLVQLVLVSWLLIAISWNVRRLQVVRGDGDEKKEEAKPEEVFGIKKPRSITTVSESDTATVVRARLSKGQIASEVAKVSRNLGSMHGTIPNGVRVIESPTVEGELEIKFIWKDLLKATFPYAGPNNIGGSISDPMFFGVNEENEEMFVILGPNYDKGIAPGHLKIGGMPRSGKGVLVLILGCETCSRVDVFPMFSDHAKGEQMLGMLRPGLPREKTWINTTEGGVLVQGNALKRAMRARNKALGKAGYSSWTPKAFKDERLRMPALVWFIEEAASVIPKNQTLFTQLANEALSAGIFLVTSLQRLSHDQLPTSLRSAMSNGICFGTDDDVDAGFVLSDETLSTGVTPGQWKVRYPGRMMCSLNGVPDRMNLVPGRTFFGMTLEDFESFIPEIMSGLSGIRPDLDPVTREAFGEEFADYLSGGGTDPEETPEIDEPTTRPNGEVGYNAAAPVVRDSDRSESMTTENEIPDDDEFVIPESPEPIISDGMNPREELPGLDGPDLELTIPGPRSMRRFSRQEKEKIWKDILVKFSGQSGVTTGQFVDEWCEALGMPEANQRSTVADFITDSCESGLLTRERRGHFTVPVSARAHAPQSVNG
jgi:hypothetical protein